MARDVKHNLACESSSCVEKTPFVQQSFCANCGSRGELMYSGLKSRRAALNERYDLFRCVTCDLVFLSPRPARRLLTDIYSGPYHSHTVVTERRGLFKVIKTLCLLPYRLRFGLETGTFPPFGGSRVLDIGCGTGDYLAAMSALGWQCFGCEVSEAALTVARRRVPEATLYHGTLDEIPLEHDSFEAVTLWHALEHLEDPLKALKRIRDLLVTDGRLLVALPNIDSLEAKVFGRRWLEMDIPGHLFYFSLETLRMLLEKAGFKCAGSRPQVHPSTVSDSLDFCLDDLWGVKQSRQRKWLYYMLFPVTAASYALGNWGCIELAAVKGKAEGLR